MPVLRMFAPDLNTCPLVTGHALQQAWVYQNIILKATRSKDWRGNFSGGRFWLAAGKRVFDVSSGLQCALPVQCDQPEVTSVTTIHAKAVRMHRLGRIRNRHFYAPVMADRAMDVMLSLFIGEVQASVVSDTALAVSNGLSREELRTVTEKLVQAGLVLVSDEKSERRAVGLTPLGSARMRSFVNDYPDV